MVVCLIALPPWTIVACLGPGAVGLAHAAIKAHVPELKSWGVAFAVALAGSTLPIAAGGSLPWPPDPVMFAFLAVLVAVNAHAMDLVDLESDRAARVNTLPVARGADPVRRMFTGLVAGTAVLLLYVSPLGPAPEMPLALIFMVILLRRAGPERDRERWRLLLDGGLALPLLLRLILP
jgi:4-hydroxybenzoate polyprenyltransferase